jgi:hypothetical protein
LESEWITLYQEPDQQQPEKDLRVHYEGEWRKVGSSLWEQGDRKKGQLKGKRQGEQQGVFESVENLSVSVLCEIYWSRNET